MLKPRILIFIFSTILVVFLFYLPKIVVDNENEGLSQKPENSDTARPPTVDSLKSSLEAHKGIISTEVQQQIDRLRNSYLTSENQENSVIFADSLAVLFSQLNKLDSAAKYVELSTENNELIGNAYYDAFTFAVDAEKARQLGAKAREYYQKVLDDNPSKQNVKTKIAMTYVSSENPMQGIMMLREVIETDPDNEEALFNLGILSIQSGQYDKAIERFESLIIKYPENTQAEFYLALSYFNNGQSASARSLFEKIKNKSNDEQLLAAVESYLNELK